MTLSLSLWLLFGLNYVLSRLALQRHQGEGSQGDLSPSIQSRWHQTGEHTCDQDMSWVRMKSQKYQGYLQEIGPRLREVRNTRLVRVRTYRGWVNAPWRLGAPPLRDQASRCLTSATMYTMVRSGLNSRWHLIQWLEVSISWLTNLATSQ